ncbi:MAG: hypothetical protein LC677_04285 [Halomonas sp.]|nr:hypothetical protein [Halomonas sp.]
MRETLTSILCVDAIPNCSRKGVSAAVILLGSQLGALFTAASPQKLILAVLGLAAGIALLIALKRYATSRSAKRSQLKEK